MKHKLKMLSKYFPIFHINCLFLCFFLINFLQCLSSVREFSLNIVKIFKIPKKNKIKNCKDSSFGQDLTEFSKIPMPESLQFF
jgi:hypothetical protein